MERRKEMDDDRYDFTDKEYQELKDQLSEQEREEIEALEKFGNDRTVSYHEFYAMVEKYKTGTCWSRKRVAKLVASPMYQLRLCLLHRAARLRGIITE